MKLEYQIFSGTDADCLTAEIWQKNELVANIVKAKGGFQIEIFPSSKGTPWSFHLGEFLDVVCTAKEKLKDSTAYD